MVCTKGEARLKLKIKKKEKKKSRMSSIVIWIIIFLAGLVILLYPYFSNWLSTRKNSVVVDSYDAMTVNLSKEEANEQWNRAVVYNEHLIGDPVRDPFVPGSGRALPSNYLDVLNFDGVMCYVEIPSVNIKLPVYHGASDEVLEKGVGHIESTALPVGGIGGHAVLTGHTGLPAAKLFTDLDKVKEGDLFYIHVLGRLLVYEVDQISVIDPEDISLLVAYGDKDYITLLTCTPYGINSHRLLVRGERTFRYSKTIRFYEDTILYQVLFGVFITLFLICAMSYSVMHWLANKQKWVLKIEGLKMEKGWGRPHGYEENAKKEMQ